MTNFYDAINNSFIKKQIKDAFSPDGNPAFYYSLEFGDGYELAVEPLLFDEQFYLALYKNKALLFKEKIVVKPGKKEESIVGSETNAQFFSRLLKEVQDREGKDDRKDCGDDDEFVIAMARKTKEGKMKRVIAGRMKDEVLLCGTLGMGITKLLLVRKKEKGNLTEVEEKMLKLVELQDKKFLSSD